MNNEKKSNVPAPLKSVKINAILFKLFWYKVFVHFCQFPSGFRVSHQLNSKNNGPVLFLTLLLGIDTASCQLLRRMALHTWLIPGKFIIFPIIGTLRKKLITTGKNPLRKKTEAVTTL